VVELENRTTITYKGNYSAFARQKAARIEEQRKIYREQKKEIERIEQAIQTLFSDRKFSRRDSKIKQLERIGRVAQVREAQIVKIRVNEAIRSGREVVRLSRLAKSYPGKDLFAGVDFVVERGRKVGVVGPNGSGKTTMLKIIADRETADSGEVILGHNVKPVYFAQEFDHLVQTRSVLEELLADADLTAPQARDLLAKFLFMGDDAFKPVSVLSGGELCRLALAKVLAKSPNLLLLDEPTNHLDIASCEALEDALRAFNGTVIACSHDRYLLDAISDEIVEIKDGAFSHYLGNYSRYREKTWQPQAIPEAAKPVEPPKQRRVSALREMERQIRELARQQKQLEDEIHALEARIAEITAALGDEENYRGGAIKDLTSEYDSLTTRLDGLYAEWEQVCKKVVEAEEALKELNIS
jgi:ATP-binding cassette subfamily F protein 3